MVWVIWYRQGRKIRYNEALTLHLARYECQSSGPFNFSLYSRSFKRLSPWSLCHSAWLVTVDFNTELDKCCHGHLAANFYPEITFPQRSEFLLFVLGTEIGSFIWNETAAHGLSFTAVFVIVSFYSTVWQWFIGAFAKLSKATMSFVRAVFLPVCMFACNNSAPIGRILTKFCVWVFFENLSRKLKLN